ncbi:MAG TPA: transposase [Gemmatimonadaceae bacterium]|nr:transposase [Gemmatimonadaceae bacterium]
MPRTPRLVAAGQPMHIIQRGNNRTSVFVDRADRERYLRMLHHASRRERCAIHAYVLMTNHVHILATPDGKRGPARMMQALGRWYVPYFNARHRRTGTLWEGRYRSRLIDSERYLLACSRYIEMNPVRAGLVVVPGAYRWSSFRGNGEGAPDYLVTAHPAYRALGASPAERRAAYRALFSVPLEEAEVSAIRPGTAQEISMQEVGSRSS